MRFGKEVTISLLLVAFIIGCTGQTPEQTKVLCTKGLVNSLVRLVGEESSDAFFVGEFLNGTIEDPVWNGNITVGDQDNCKLSIVMNNSYVDYYVEKDEFGDYGLTKACSGSVLAGETCFTYEMLSTFLSMFIGMYDQTSSCASPWATGFPTSGGVGILSNGFLFSSDGSGEVILINNAAEDITISDIVIDTYINNTVITVLRGQTVSLFLEAGDVTTGTIGDCYRFSVSITYTRPSLTTNLVATGTLQGAHQ